MDTSVSRYYHVLEQIEAAAQLSGRDPKGIKLIIVSKQQPWESLRPLYLNGVRCFGESRLQEALIKIADAPKDISWHCIGTLQKNKVRKAIGLFSLIHSVDSLELAAKISSCSAECGLVSEILIQANCSGESSKHGLSPEAWKNALETLLALPALKIQGLMTMAPFQASDAQARRCFASLRILREELKEASAGQLILPHLSMGMSADFHSAIAEGASLIRIGSAIFKGEC